MVSLCWLLGAGRCPGRWTAIDAGAGTLLDVTRAARVRTVIDAGIGTAGLHKVWSRWRGATRTIPARSGTTLRVREPWPEASWALGKSLPSGALQLPSSAALTKARAHTAERAERFAATGRASENDACLAARAATAGLPHPHTPDHHKLCPPPPSRAGPSCAQVQYVSKMSI